MRGRSIDFYPFFSNHKTLSTQRPAIKNHFSSAVHTIASQLSIFPRGHESMAKKKKVANKATHQQAEMWEPGVFGPVPLCHADNLLPIFCQFFFFVFFSRAVRITPLVCLQLCSNWKITTCTTISVSVHFFAPRIGWGKGLGFRAADNRF